VAHDHLIDAVRVTSSQLLAPAISWSRQAWTCQARAMACELTAWTQMLARVAARRHPHPLPQGELIRASLTAIAREFPKIAKRPSRCCVKGAFCSLTTS
jgi:hypothetical protein